MVWVGGGWRGGYVAIDRLRLRRELAAKRVIVQFVVTPKGKRDTKVALLKFAIQSSQLGPDGHDVCHTGQRKQNPKAEKLHTDLIGTVLSIVSTGNDQRRQY